MIREDLNRPIHSTTGKRLLVLGVSAIALLLFTQHTLAAELTPEKKRAKAIFKELVETDTTHSTGDTLIASQRMAKHLLDAGFAAEDVQVINNAPRKGNLVARYRSPAPTKKPILFLAHIDVVEANPEDWNLPPFEFIEQDGYYYGRGTIDDKDEAAIAVANFITLKEQGFVPNRDIIIALTADEEGGEENGVIYLLENHRDLVDAAFVINEGGGGGLRQGKPVGNSVQAAEKVYQSYTLEITNRGGHSSLPRKDNAIYELAQALGAIQNHNFPVRFNEVTRAYFKATSLTMTAKDSEAMQELLKNPSNADAASRFAEVPSVNSRLRTTCVATQLDAGHAENALPQRARATVNCRILPGVTPASIQAELARLVDNKEVSITPVRPPTPSDASPLSEEVLDPIMQITEELWPGTPVVPIMSTGATDGLFFRNAGIPVYGVSGIFSDMDDVRAHGRDERIGIDAFFKGLSFQEKLIKAFAGQ